MPDTIVQLGDFQFLNTEVPERLPFGGDQLLVVHELVGGTRVIDAMGRSDKAIAWSGLFLGAQANDRAATLDAMRIAGIPLALNWGTKSYTVVIHAFEADYERFYRIPYSIVCEVLADLATPTIASADLSLDDQMNSDMGAAMTTGGLIGDSTLNGLLSGLQSAVSNVDSFVDATRSEIASVTAPLLATQAQVRVLIGTVSPLVDGVAALGGVVPFAPFGQAATALQGQIADFGELSNLYSLQATLGRMSTNLAADGVSGRLVTTAGGDLYHIAAAQYGDATDWTTIARANQLTDPVLPGVQNLTVPPAPDNADGILTV